MDCAVHGGQGRSKKGQLAREVEQREMVRRVQEAQKAELAKLYASSSALEHIEKSSFQGEVKRREREVQERQSEAQLLAQVYQAEKTRELALIRSEEEERIATALAKRAHDKECKEREILQLREQSAELRDLVEKIRIAKVTKERAVQVKEQRELRQQQQEYEAAFNQYIGQVDAAAGVKQAEFEARKRDLNVKARMVLEEQIQEKQDAIRAAEEEFQRERAMVDEVMRRIQEEDMAEDAARRQKGEETKAFIRKFLEENERAKAAKKEALRAEDRKIQEHWDQVREREAADAGKKAERKVEADRMYEKVKRDMEEQMARREEEDYLIGLLRQEDLEIKHRAAEEEKRLKQERLKREIMEANDQQRRERERRDAEAKADEEAFRIAAMAKFAEDDRLEQMNAQKRRMKTMEHQRAVQAMIDDKRQAYMEQKAREEIELAARRIEDERKLALVEEERRRLLAEAAQLGIEFLPPGVIRDQRDLDYIRSLGYA